MSLVRKDLINSLVLIIFGGIVYYGILDIPIRGVAKTEADFFPKIVIGILFFLSFLLLAKSIYTLVMNKSKEDTVKKENIKSVFKENSKVIYTFIIFTVYIFLLQGVGYFISSVLFLFSLYLVLMPGKKRYIAGIIGSVLFTLLLFVIFRYGLSVYLPEGKWF